MSDQPEEPTGQEIPPVTVQGPLGNINKDVQRVFVGLPDVFEPEQLARLHAMGFVKEARWLLPDKRTSDEKPQTVTEAALEWLEMADHFTDYILSGAKPQVPAEVKS